MKLLISKSDFKKKSTTALTKLVQGLIRANGEMKYQELSEVLGCKLHTLQSKVPTTYLSVSDANDLFNLEIPNEILSDEQLTAFQKLVYGFKYSFKDVTAKWLISKFNEFGMFRYNYFRKQVYDIFTDGRVTFQNINRWIVGKFQSKDSEPIDNTTQESNALKRAIPAQESASIEITSDREKELLERIENLEQSLKEKDDKISELQNTLDNIDNTINSVDDRDSKIEDLQRRLKCTEQQRREETHEKCEAQKKCKEMEEYCNKLEEYAKSCNKAKAEAEFKYSQLQKASTDIIYEYEVKIEGYEAKIDTLQGEISEINVQMGNITQGNSNVLIRAIPEQIEPIIESAEVVENNSNLFLLQRVEKDLEYVNN